MIKSVLINLFLLCLLRLPINAQKNDIKSKRNLNISFNAGLIANNGFSNLFDNNLNYSSINSKYYSYNSSFIKVNSKTVCFGMNLGTEIQIGRNKLCNQIVAINYDITNSKYNFNSTYKSTIVNNYIYEIKNLEIKKNAHFISFGYGIISNLPYNISLSALANINLNVNNNEKQSGTILTANNSVVFNDTLVISNIKVKNNLDTAFLSIRLKRSKEIIIRSKTYGLFVQRNISLRAYHKNKYIAPWWIIGILFKPFKK